jgi:hypothetical protein
VKLEEAIRTYHDEWAKDALELWLQGLGHVQLDVRIAGTVRRGDVLFTEEKPQRRRRKMLGLLGKLARGSVLFEPFHNPVTPWEILTCIAKATECTAQQMRKARRAKRSMSTVKPTELCLVTPSASAQLKAAAELTLVAPMQPGVYRMATLLNTVIIVVDELPKDASTLWLRLLGRGEIRLQAVEELVQMQANKSLGDATMHLLTAWRQSLPKSILTNFEQETAMNWRRVYEKWEQKTFMKFKLEGKAEGIAKGIAKGKAEGKLEGKLEGKAEGKAEAIVIMLEARGLSLTATQRKQVLQCRDAAQLDAWLRTASTTSDVKALLALPAPSVQPTTRRRTTRRAA